MSDIELVIRISEETYKATCNRNILPPDIKDAVDALRNGTPLLSERFMNDIFEKMTEEEQALVLALFMIFNKDKIIEKTDVKDETDNLVEIGTLDTGITIEVSGIQMEILDKPLTMKNGKEISAAVFCLAKNILFVQSFDEYNDNNWKRSTLREYLNGKYKDGLPDELKEALIPFKRDLLTDDGMKDYGSCTDLISLISKREYQDYREYISDKSDWWWTLTALSAKPGYTSSQYVRTDGSLSSSPAYFGHTGVSPVFLLRPSLKVKIVKGSDKE